MSFQLGVRHLGAPSNWRQMGPTSLPLRVPSVYYLFRPHVNLNLQRMLHRLTDAHETSSSLSLYVLDALEVEGFKLVVGLVSSQFVWGCG